MAPTAEARLSWLLGAAAVGLLLAAVLVPSWLAFSSPRAAFLTGGKGDWIGAPSGVTSDAIFVDRSRVPALRFERRLSLSRVPEQAVLVVRALREAEVEFNGERVATLPPAGGSWRTGVEIDVAPLLRKGPNELHIAVRNASGPALLQLWSPHGALDLQTDERWQVVAPGGARANARLADDTVLYPEALLSPSPRRAARAWFPLCIALFAAGAIATWWIERLPEARRRQLPALTAGAMTVYWLALFAFKFVQLPVAMGFDVPAHLLYIDFIREQRALPLATDGWSSYHPPLFYLLTTGLVSLFDVARESLAGRVVYRSITAGSGLALVWLAWTTARRLFDDDPLRTSLAVAFAGLLPMNVYMAAYVNNEPLHAALVGLSFWLACRVLVAAGRPRAFDVGLLAGALGLALLTKYTALIALAVVPPFVAARRFAIDEWRPARALASAAGVVLGAIALAGWFYARNQIHFGTPLVMNTEALGDIGWWMQPGFHTADWYTSFGEVLRHPFFSGFASFGDGVYSTFWGDGLVAGMARVTTRHPLWNYEAMVLVYWVALPASALIAAGAVRAISLARRDPEPGRRAAFALATALVFTFALALLAITLLVPYYAQAKAFYALGATVPLSLLAALGLAWPLERLAGPGRAPARALYGGFLALLGGLLVLSYLG